MNLPNKLTLGRMIATPLFMAAFAFDFPNHYLVALVLFAAASLTDLIDGKIARSRNLVTNFGKFLDPLADKMLTTAAFLGFLFRGGEWGISTHILWITFIVLFREFMVTSIRLVLVSGEGKVVAANIWGKCKTATQMAGIVLTLFCYTLIDDFGMTAIQSISNIVICVVLWISAVLCVVSGLTYLIGAKDAIDPTK